MPAARVMSVKATVESGVGSGCVRVCPRAAELKAVSKGKSANWRKVRRIIREGRITGSARSPSHLTAAVPF